MRCRAATDRCGNHTVFVQTVTVQDTTPPVIQGGNADLYCLWPPNHKYRCFGQGDFDLAITDNCSSPPFTWTFDGCASDQPDNANGVGDGDTVNDCLVAPDRQSFCVRSERDGTVPGGRHYGVTVMAVDACGNASGLMLVGYVYVPHDMSPELDCLPPDGGQ